MRAGELTCLAGADDRAATVLARYFVIGVVRITWGRRAKDCRPHLLRSGFRHTGAELTAALGLAGRRAPLEGDTQLRKTRTKRGLQRMTSSSELLRY